MDDQIVMNNLKSSLLIFVSALTWSVFSIYAEVGEIDNISVVLLYAHLAATTFFLLAPRKCVRVIRVGFTKAPSLLLFATLTPFLVQVSFILAGGFIPSTFANFIMELWPIMMILVVPKLLGRIENWAPASLKFVAFPLASLGLLAIAGSAFYHNYADGYQLGAVSALAGLSLAILAALFLSFAIIKVKLAEFVFPDDNTVSSSLSVVVACRILPIPFLLLSVVLLDQNILDLNAAIYGSLIGFFSLGLSTVLGDQGVRTASSGAPLLIFYYAPLLGAFWLVFFFDAPFPEGLAIGATLIVVANAYVDITIRRLSLILTLFLSMLYVIFTLLVQYEGADTATALTLVLVFFSISSASTQTRVHARLSAAVQAITKYGTTSADSLNTSSIETWMLVNNLSPQRRNLLKQIMKSDRYVSDVIVLVGLGVSVIVLTLMLGNDQPWKIVVGLTLIASTVFVVCTTTEMLTDSFLMSSARRVVGSEDDSSEVFSFVFAFIVVSALMLASIFLF